MNPFYQYDEPGNYTVTLTVEDDYGNTDTTSTYAEITRGDPPLIQLIYPTGGKIQRYTKDQILEKVRDAIKDTSPSNSNDGKDAIKQLKDRVGKMSEKSKGISLKGVDITRKVEDWIKQSGYKLSGSTLLVK